MDITARRRGHKYAVQCKFYSHPVGVSAVQQVVGGMAYYDCDRAMVITNNTFTRQAKELARRFNLKESGGSDFHGTVKPDIQLGSGRGNLKVPYEFKENLEKSAKK